MPMRADAGGGEIHRARRAEAAGADAEHAAGLQPALPVDADLRHDEMPAVALDFVVGQLRQRRSDVRPTVRIERAARHRRDDAHRVAGRHRRLLLLQIPDVLVVHVDVDEAAQLALLVVQVRLQPRVLRRQVGEQLADGRAVGLDRVFLIGVRPERCRNQNFRRHVEARPRRNCDRSSLRNHTVMSPASSGGDRHDDVAKFGHA